MAQAVASNPLHDIGWALRRPEELAVRWRDSLRSPATAVVLTMSTLACLAIYGLTMGMPNGLSSMGRDALLVPLGALIAWCVSFPALYIVNAARGSPLDRSTMGMAALMAVHFGALARLASAPLSWFFGLTIHAPWALTALHMLVFGATALCMADVFLRVMKALDARSGRWFHLIWLCLVAVIDVELKLVLFHI